MPEIWKSVVGYEGRYEVSDSGRVRSLNYGNTGEVRVLCVDLSVNGYLRVDLAGRKFLVHRLVAAAFIGQSEAGMQVNHKSGIKTNNSVTNLEYCSASQNRKHAFRIGLQSSKGERHSCAKLTEVDIVEIRQMCASGIPQKEVAKVKNVNQSTISRVSTGARWPHVALSREGG